MIAASTLVAFRANHLRESQKSEIQAGISVDKYYANGSGACKRMKTQ
jgi:hypothetical protein